MIYFDQKLDKSDFIISAKNITPDIYVDKDDYWGVKRAVNDLQGDLNKVTDKSYQIKSNIEDLTGNPIIIGTIGKSKIIDKCIAEGKLVVKETNGCWESFTIQTVEDPCSGLEKALFIVGSDKRGTIFGIYELSRKIGISPWYWWADVEIEKRNNIFFHHGIYNQGEPSVKYRGIFLNDEAPCLTTWVEKTFGSFNHKFYEKVFELLLRLKANYLWPAMWKPRVFNEEDPLNPEMADKYGIVMGTSHHEPMMRSWEEWAKIGQGPWDYSKNSDNIYKFWENSIERIKDYESIITVGMRGDGDEAMSESSSMEEKIDLLENIIDDQREILEKKINDDIENIPQILALYKEVQSFYEQGMEVPEDITLMLADDNFGNIRMLPSVEDRKRKGGYGMYYHFDYVGGPRTYQWINTIPLKKIWDQMTLTYNYGVDKIWIVNVGDLKPMELPIDFFLDIAWDIGKWNHNTIDLFVKKWTAEQFDEKYSDKIAHILQKYTKYNGRRKPELVVEDTYSLINYQEAERVLANFDEIVDMAEDIYDSIDESKKDAFFQLILYPTRASRNILKMHVFAAKNKLYAKQGRTLANDYAELTKEVYEAEAADSQYYNKEMSDGKWDGMMIQPHIGKSNWRGPEENEMPSVEYIDVESGSEMGIAVEESYQTWPGSKEKCKLPVFSRFTRRKHYIEVFNKKKDPFDYHISSDRDWIKISSTEGSIEKQKRIWVSIDWSNVPTGIEITGTLIVTGSGQEVKIEVQVSNPLKPSIGELDEMTFVESEGYISIEVEHYANSVSGEKTSWIRVLDYGRTLSSMLVIPRKLEAFTTQEILPYLEYKIYINNPGLINVKVYTSPALNVNRDRGLRYTVSFDGKDEKIVDTFPPEYDADHGCELWALGVMNNAHITESKHMVEEKGLHTLKIKVMDPGIAIQKIVLDMGGVKPSYLGPLESFFAKQNK